MLVSKTKSYNNKYYYITYYLTILSIVLTVITISFGSYTRLKHAGLGCPDWPGCYGNLKVPTSKYELNVAKTNFPNISIDINKAKIEMFHRYIASVLFILILSILIMSFMLRKYKHPILLPSTIFLVVVMQAMFGMWTVTLKLLPIIVTFHLMGGITILSLLFILFLNLKNSLNKNNEKFDKKYKLKGIIEFTGIVLIVQIFLGGWVSTNYAGLGCTNFPYCNEFIFPNKMEMKGCFDFLSFNNYNKEMIHFIHRATGIICAILISTIAFLKRNIFLFSVLFAQILLGILNVIYLLPIYLAVMHNFFACALLLTFIKTYYDNKRLY
jgi:cytochrome c oxidase assembly protein subunit 15